jgi:hypothetical protein
MLDVPFAFGYFSWFIMENKMARIEKRETAKKKMLSESLPFTKLNYQILSAGILCITLGYIALAQDPWNGTMPLVVAPILLLLGYCVVIPVGILFRRKTNTENISKPKEMILENSH